MPAPGIAIGGDVFPGSTLSDHCLRYENIPQIKLIVVLGELGGRVRSWRRVCVTACTAVKFQARVAHSAVQCGIHPVLRHRVLSGACSLQDEYSLVEALQAKRVTKPVVAWVSGTCAKLFKSEVQFGHAGAKSGGALESAQGSSPCCYPAFRVPNFAASDLPRPQAIDASAAGGYWLANMCCRSHGLLVCAEQEPGSEGGGGHRARILRGSGGHHCQGLPAAGGRRHHPAAPGADAAHCAPGPGGCAEGWQGAAAVLETGAHYVLYRQNHYMSRCQGGYRDLLPSTLVSTVATVQQC